MNRRVLSALAGTVIAAGLASGCATSEDRRLRPADVREVLANFPTMERESAAAETARRAETEVRESEGPPGAIDDARPTGQDLALTGASSAAFENAPIPEFINAVFVETLGLSVTIDEQVAQRRELVTLRTPESLPSRELFNVAAAALSAYGVSTVATGERSVRFLPETASGEIAPTYVRGRSTPETPADLRPIFHYYPTRSLAADDLNRLVNGLTPRRVTIRPSPMDSALLLLGPPEPVRDAVALLRQVDQPRFAGRRSIRINPAFLGARELAETLTTVLNAEGVSAGDDFDSSPVLVLPFRTLNAVYVMSRDADILSYVERKARELDTPNQVGEGRRAFVYYVQNTSAETLAEIANAVTGQTGAARSGVDEAGRALRPGEQVQTNTGPSAGEARSDGENIVVDTGRNALIFVGAAEEYATLLPILRELDRPPGEVLIEASIVEVTLNEGENFGIDFLTDFAVGEFGAELSTRDGVGLGSSGLLFRVFDNTGAVRGVLNASARDERVSILSNPRVMARSGLEASIEVGTEVPILRQSATDGTVGNGSGIVNSVEYRRTGVILTVTPVVRSDERIDLELTQELSEAQSNDTSDISSPIILNRSISTALSLRDGQTVILGGLISENNSETTRGVPGLSDVPLVGNLFRSQSVGRQKTELLVFITPYLIDTTERADAVTGLFQAEMETWPDIAGRLDLF